MSDDIGYVSEDFQQPALPDKEMIPYLAMETNSPATYAIHLPWKWAR
ncbi:MAG: hypothetical protein JST09_10905 [Bacteroidetes bacterium]|nr:hypothetical protein [Bacteroidota bacterium]